MFRREATAEEPPLPAAVTVDLDGIRIATRVLPSPTASSGDIILCHGTPGSSWVWHRVVRELSREYRVFLWDMPGYGDSDQHPSVAVDLRSQGARLARLVEHWSLERPHVVADDVGGAVALRAHLLHGVEYADLFLWDAVTLDHWGSPFFQLVAQNTDVFTQLPPSLHAALVAEYIAVQRLAQADVDALVRPWASATGQGAFYRQIAARDPADTRPISDRLAEVRSATRIGWGFADPWIPVAQAVELQSRLPGLPDVIVRDGVGHLATLEDPDGVTAALREWLARAA